MKTPTIVLGVIGMDVHAVGNKILEYVFTSAGFRVVNLGVIVSQSEFINAAIETAADVIMVSSLCGHGEVDCRGLREKCFESGLNKILLYVGGNLVIGKTPFSEVERLFQKMGFNRVYSPETPLEITIRDLCKDLVLIHPGFSDFLIYDQNLNKGIEDNNGIEKSSVK